jgi:hypothetical protein
MTIEGNFLIVTSEIGKSLGTFTQLLSKLDARPQSPDAIGLCGDICSFAAHSGGDSIVSSCADTGKNQLDPEAHSSLPSQGVLPLFATPITVAPRFQKTKVVVRCNMIYWSEVCVRDKTF